MKLNTTNVNTIKSAILELFKHQLLPDPKPIHEFFQLTPIEFEEMLDERITAIFTEDACKALNALGIRCGIFTQDTIRVYSECYHIRNPTSRNLDFDDICPEESKLYGQYLDNYKRQYSENQQRFNNISKSSTRTSLYLNTKGNFSNYASRTNFNLNLFLIWAQATHLFALRARKQGKPVRWHG